MKSKEHIYERRVRLLQERIDASIERMKEYMRVDGRPAFYTKLSDKEELKLFINPTTRSLLEQNKLLLDGPVEYGKWRAEMDAKATRFAQEVMSDGSSGLP